MGSYADLTSRGSFNEATHSKQDRASGLTARQLATIELRQEAMAWVAEHIPEAVGVYDSVAAWCLILNDRDRRTRGVEAVKRRIASEYPYLVDDIAELTKGEQ